MPSVMKRALPVIVGLYILSLFTSMAGMEIFGWLTALCGLVSIVPFLKSSHFDSRLKLIWSLLLALFFSNVLSAVVNGASNQQIIEISGRMRWTLLLILISIAFLHLSNEKLFKTLKSISIVGLLIAVYAIIQHVTGIDLVRNSNRAVQPFGFYETGIQLYRSAGFMSAPLTFGNSFGMFVMSALGFLIVVRNKVDWIGRLFLFSIFLFGSVALYSTFSRGVWIAYVGSVLVTLWWLLSSRWSFFLSIAFSSLIGIFLMVSSTFLDRVMAAFRGAKSVHERFVLWSTNFEMFKDSPILGVGYGRNEDLIKEYFAKLNITDGFAGHAHSTFFQFLSGTGLVGTGLYIAVSTLLLVENYKLTKVKDLDLKALFTGLFVAQVFLHLGGLTECNFKDGEVNHFAMVIFALVLSRSK